MRLNLLAASRLAYIVSVVLLFLVLNTYVSATDLLITVGDP